MNPDSFGGKKKEPHIYTQEEAVQLNRDLWETNNTLDAVNNELDRQKKILKTALSCMEKDQLIDFAEKLIFEE